MSQATPNRADTSGPAGRDHGTRVFLIVVAVALAFAFVPRILERFTGLSGTEDAPDFTAPIVFNGETPEQKTLTLSSLRGRPVILDFWATWCGPCQVEAPIVNAIAQRYRDKGLAVVGVNTSDERGLAERFAAKKGLTFPIVYDERNAAAHAFHVDNLPTLIVISKTGKIVAIRHGVTSDSDLERLVRGVL